MILDLETSLRRSWSGSWDLESGSWSQHLLYALDIKSQFDWRDNLLATAVEEWAQRCGGRAGTAVDQYLETPRQLSSCGRPGCQSSCSLCSYADAVDATEPPPVTWQHQSTSGWMNRWLQQPDTSSITVNVLWKDQLQQTPTNEVTKPDCTKLWWICRRKCIYCRWGSPLIVHRILTIRL